MVGCQNSDDETLPWMNTTFFWASAAGRSRTDAARRSVCTVRWVMPSKMVESMRCSFEGVPSPELVVGRFDELSERVRAAQPLRRERDRERRFGGGDDLIDGDAGREFGEHQSVRGDVNDGQVGDDPVHNSLSGQRKRALVHDLR